MKNKLNNAMYYYIERLYDEKSSEAIRLASIIGIGNCANSIINCEKYIGINMLEDYIKNPHNNRLRDEAIEVLKNIKR